MSFDISRPVYAAAYPKNCFKIHTTSTDRWTAEKNGPTAAAAAAAVFRSVSQTADFGSETALKFSESTRQPAPRTKGSKALLATRSNDTTFAFRFYPLLSERKCPSLLNSLSISHIQARRPRSPDPHSEPPDTKHYKNRTREGHRSQLFKPGQFNARLFLTDYPGHLSLARAFPFFPPSGSIHVPRERLLLLLLLLLPPPEPTTALRCGLALQQYENPILTPSRQQFVVFLLWASLAKQKWKTDEKKTWYYYRPLPDPPPPIVQVQMRGPRAATKDYFIQQHKILNGCVLVVLSRRGCYVHPQRNLEKNNQNVTNHEPPPAHPDITHPPHPPCSPSP